MEIAVDEEEERGSKRAKMSVNETQDETLNVSAAACPYRRLDEAKRELAQIARRKQESDRAQTEANKEADHAANEEIETAKGKRAEAIRKADEVRAEAVRKANKACDEAVRRAESFKKGRRGGARLKRDHEAELYRAEEKPIKEREELARQNIRALEGGTAAEPDSLLILRGVSLSPVCEYLCETERFRFAFFVSKRITRSIYANVADPKPKLVEHLVKIFLKRHSDWADVLSLGGFANTKEEIDKIVFALMTKGRFEDRRRRIRRKGECTKEARKKRGKKEMKSSDLLFPRPSSPPMEFCLAFQFFARYATSLLQPQEAFLHRPSNKFLSDGKLQLKLRSEFLERRTPGHATIHLLRRSPDGSISIACLHSYRLDYYIGGISRALQFSDEYEESINILCRKGHTRADADQMWFKRSKKPLEEQEGGIALSLSLVANDWKGGEAQIGFSASSRLRSLQYGDSFKDFRANLRRNLPEEEFSSLRDCQFS